ncbi:MAG: TonB-dependent receptor [Gammaproteobacteria bacterium]|nr:TonB-dependent receptor [Gammaproteobacteria bacterium]
MKTSKFKKSAQQSKFSPVAIAALGVLLTNYASAQSASNQTTLPEVIVKSSPFKLSVPAEEVPQTVSEISNEDIENRSYRTIEEALSQVSSVQAGLAGRAGYDEFMIRGFSQSYYQFKNGLRLDPGYLQQEEIFGLERIEVLKGPSSVEYGQIAPGGVVNMVSKKPSNTPINEVGVEVGSYGLKRSTADLGGKLGDSGEWSYRIPIVLSDSNDFQNHVYSKRQFIAPTFAYRPSGRTELVIYTQYQNDDFKRSVSVPYSILRDVNKSTYLGNPYLPGFTRPQTQLGYAFEHNFDNDIKFKQSLRQTNYDLKGTSFLPSVDSPGVVADGAYYFSRKVNVLSLDNQVEKSIKDGLLEHNLMLGYDQTDYKVGKFNQGASASQSLNYTTLNYSQVGAPQLVDSGTDKIQQEGVYAKYRLKVQDLYAINFGLRNSNVSNDSYDSSGSSTSSTKLNRTTYSAGLIGFNVNGFSPFANYSESFEPITGWDPMFDGSAKPTVSQGSQKEVGVKWKSANSRHTVVTSYFDIYQTNIYNYADSQVSPGDPATAASDQRHKGLEVETSSSLKNGIDFKTSYTWLDAKIAKTQLASASGDVGSRPFGVPTQSATATLVLRGDALGFNRYTLIAGARYVGDRTIDLNGTKLPSFLTLDLGMTYKFENLTAYASIKNATNEDYFVGPYFGNVNFGAPRSLLMGIKYAL